MIFSDPLPIAKAFLPLWKTDWPLVKLLDLRTPSLFESRIRCQHHFLLVAPSIPSFGLQGLSGSSWQKVKAQWEAQGGFMGQPQQNKCFFCSSSLTILSLGLISHLGLVSPRSPGHMLDHRDAWGPYPQVSEGMTWDRCSTTCRLSSCWTIRTGLGATKRGSSVPVLCAHTGLRDTWSSPAPLLWHYCWVKKSKIKRREE